MMSIQLRFSYKIVPIRLVHEQTQNNNRVNNVTESWAKAEPYVYLILLSVLVDKVQVSILNLFLLDLKFPENEDKIRCV